MLYLVHLFCRQQDDSLSVIICCCILMYVLQRSFHLCQLATSQYYDYYCMCLRAVKLHCLYRNHMTLVQVVSDGWTSLLSILLLF